MKNSREREFPGPGCHTLPHCVVRCIWAGITIHNQCVAVHLQPHCACGLVLPALWIMTATASLASGHCTVLAKYERGRKKYAKKTCPQAITSRIHKDISGWWPLHPYLASSSLYECILYLDQPVLPHSLFGWTRILKMPISDMTAMFTAKNRSQWLRWHPSLPIHKWRHLRL